MDKRFEALFGASTPEKKEAIEAAKIEMDARKLRKELSFFHCRIPDWRGQGGMVEFWINDDGSFETEDTRLDDTKIRDGVESLLRIKKHE